MMELNTWCQDDCTLGRLSFEGFHCFTLELPWRDNQRSISCVPAGDYNLSRYNSPRHGEVLLLRDVPDRDWIEIHPGNFTRQIEGCILVGDSIKHLDSDGTPDVTNSRNTMTRLLEALRLERALSLRIRRVVMEGQ